MTTPPNIVLILVDDADAKVLEHAACDRIRAALMYDGSTRVGTKATRYLVTQPLCAPSRASLLRGRYPQNTGINSNYNAFVKFGRSGAASNIARWLKAAPRQYQTALIGKYMNHYEPNQYPRPDVGFDYWFGVGSGGYDNFKYWVWDDYRAAGDKKHQYGDDTDPANYLTDVLRGKALQFLENQSASVPFFMMVTPTAPHWKAIPAPRHGSLYSNESYPKDSQNPSFDEDDVSDKPWYVANQPDVSGDQIAKIDDYWRRWLRCMESVADLVEAVIAKLREKSFLDNTYVFFTSDHGYHMGEHKLAASIQQDEAEDDAPGGKNTMYEEDIRVPMWIRHPGIAGPTVDQLLGNVDLAPTFCDIAGIDLVNGPPDVLDGRSFLPLLNGSSVTWRTQYLITRGDTVTGEGKAFVGFRHKDEWVFEQLLSPAPNEIAGEYYVGLDDPATGDPFELSNGYRNLGASRLADLKSLASDYGACAGDSCRVADRRSI